PGGTAYLDNCDICVGGNTGNTPCVEDCTGVFGGSAQPGTWCDDGNPNTIDDAYNANCECVGTPAPPACNTYYASDANLNLAIPDNTAISSTINVPESGTITELVCVTVNIQHTWVGDLAIKLAHNGTEVQLIRRTGTGSFGDGSVLNGNYTFCATGSDFVAAALATGSFAIIPTSPPNYARSNNSSSSQTTPPAISGTYADFVGLDVSGNWTLTISDHVIDYTGTLRNWSFEVCTGGAAVPDCNGTPGGTASVDACGVCSGGTTGLTPNATCLDCNGTPNGTASVDACGVCSGGTTGLTPNATCLDCNGTPNGTASIDACGVCSGGTTDLIPNATCLDCNGTPNGTAYFDDCDICVGGNTGLEACVEDCNGDLGGTASIDNCGNCTGGNTGTEPNTPITNTTTANACGSYTWAVTGITYTQPGTYTVTVSDCLIEQLVLTIPPGQVVSLTGNTTVCAGSVIGLTATGGNQYQWSGPNGYSATGGGSITRTNATLSMSGTYTVTITNNECVTILSTTVTVYPIPAATITGATPVCSGGAISLSAPAGAESYAWSGPGGFTASGATINRPNATTATAGTYTVTVTGAGGCTATASRSVSVSAPTTATITGATGFCSNGAVTLTATTAGVSYQWSGPGGFSFSGATMTRTPAVAGTYTVTVQNAAGCISTASRTVSVTAAPTVNIANYTTCTRIYLIASGGNSYAWSGPNGFTATGTTVNRNNPTATMWGTYTVTVTSGGCTATASITVSPCGSGKNAGEELTQNMSVYPNPTGSISNINFYAQTEELLTLKVFAADGKEVAVLFNQTAQPDTAYSVVFDATQLPNGTYYAVLSHANGTQETLPVLVTK
ncbi:MAG TPA: T9SS type A sorting domain-containing protein, partial [Chitinophagales bacterium]|nr:T9SS type A sorting domain-containing protein [Chitinophagales bacterium]